MTKVFVVMSAVDWEGDFMVSIWAEERDAQNEVDRLNAKWSGSLGSKFFVQEEEVHYASR